MEIDFENMEPGTLLLCVERAGNALSGKIVKFKSCGQHGDIWVNDGGRKWRHPKEFVECVVPPKPEIEGREAVEFRVPDDGDVVSSFDGSYRFLIKSSSNVVDRPGIGRRRWIMERKETEHVENLKQKEEVMPIELNITKPISEKPMKEQSSLKSKLKSLLWWSVAPPTLLAKHAALKSNWIGWTLVAAGVTWYAWLASTGQVEVPTLQSPFKW